MKLPKVDFKAFEEFKKKNFEERLKNIDRYVEWLKKTSNKEWSSQVKNILTINK